MTVSYQYHHSDKQADELVSEQAATIAVIRIQRSEVRNAVDPATAQALYDAFMRFEQDDRAKVAVLYGDQQAFCAGYDLTALTQQKTAWLEALHWGEQVNGKSSQLKSTQLKSVQPLGPMGPTRMSLSKPVIAAIEGPAVAGGMELALWCDLRVMAEDAYMGVYCRRWGVPLIDGGTVRLPKLVGLSRAQELIMTGRKVTAQESQQIGLCNQLAKPGDSLAAAVELADKIAAFPQACMNVDRINARGADKELVDLQQEFARGIQVLASEALPGAMRFAAGAGRHGESAN